MASRFGRRDALGSCIILTRIHIFLTFGVLLDLITPWVILRRTWMSSQTLNIGAALPTFTLPNQRGDMLLSNAVFQESSTTLLAFYRGHW